MRRECNLQRNIEGLLGKVGWVAVLANMSWSSVKAPHTRLRRHICLSEVAAWAPRGKRKAPLHPIFLRPPQRADAML